MEISVCNVDTSHCGSYAPWSPQYILPEASQKLSLIRYDLYSTVFIISYVYQPISITYS